MSGVTSTYVAHYPHALKTHEVVRWGGCDHVTADASLLYVISYEHTATGKQGVCLCEQCYGAEMGQEGLQTQCHDCKLFFNISETIRWSVYDDVHHQKVDTLHLCTRCQSSATHQRRLFSSLSNASAVQWYQR